MTVFVVWQRIYRADGQNAEPLPIIVGVYSTPDAAMDALRSAPVGCYREMKSSTLFR